MATCRSSYIKHEVAKKLVMMWSLTSGLVVSGCGADASNAPSTEARVNISVSALTGEDLSDACYHLSVRDEDGHTIWTEQSLCASSFGSGTEIGYVGVCNAQASQHEAVLELLQLIDTAGDPIDAGRYVNPCPPGQGCAHAFTCVENSDAQVSFDLTVLLDAETGFVDSAVNVDFLECSAKVDCVDDEGEPLMFLHDAGGQRGQTVVLGLSCNTEPCLVPGVELYFNTLIVRCTEGTALVDVGLPGPAPIVQDAPILFGSTVFSGTSAFGSAFYNNVALGFLGGSNCTVKLRATASDVPFVGGFIPPQQPLINWNVRLTNPAGELVCGRNGLDESVGVSTVYLSSQRLRNSRLFSADPGECEGLQP